MLLCIICYLQLPEANSVLLSKPPLASVELHPGTGTHTRHLELQIINYCVNLIFHAYLLGNNGKQSCGSRTVGIQFDLYTHAFCVLVTCTWTVLRIPCCLKT